MPSITHSHVPAPIHNQLRLRAPKGFRCLRNSSTKRCAERSHRCRASGSWRRISPQSVVAAPFAPRSVAHSWWRRSSRIGSMATQVPGPHGDLSDRRVPQRLPPSALRRALQVGRLTLRKRSVRPQSAPRSKLTLHTTRPGRGSLEGRNERRGQCSYQW